MTSKLVVTFALLLCATASSAFGAAVPAPEIDGNTAVSAVTLIAGGLMVIRGRKR